MHVGMTLTLVAAARARLRARLEQRTHQLLIAGDLARERGTGRRAYIVTPR
jgi:hypothetical protein